jgi:hypothetical protein
VIALILSFTGGIYLSHQLSVGTVSIGEAIMYPDHPYNIASRKVGEKFLGAARWSW